MSGRIGSAPTMGALHAAMERLPGGADNLRAGGDEPLREPRAVQGRADLKGYPGARSAPRTSLGPPASTSSRAGATELYPPGYDTWVEVTELGAVARGGAPPGPLRGVATICLKLFTSSGPRRVYLGPEGRAAGGGAPQMTSDLNPRSGSGRADRPRPTASRWSRNARLSPEDRARSARGPPGGSKPTTTANPPSRYRSCRA